MKSYPSITKEITGETYYIFDKLDGSNLRFEWDRKRGWYKFGSRTKVITEKTPVFGESIPMFLTSMGSQLVEVFKLQKWENVTVFCEFYGEKSCFGFHDPDDKKFLSMIDVSVHKKGFIEPKLLLDLFQGHVPTPRFLGEHVWDEEFVKTVFDGSFQCSFEGVIGKSGSSHQRKMLKAKTKRWLDLAKEKLSEAEYLMVSQS